jgi:nicotinamide-nucleotide amidase
VQKMSVRWLKHESPYELEFEGVSDENLRTRTGASSVTTVSKRYHSPKDLVALGIAGCTGVDVVSILKKMRQPLEELIIETVTTSTHDHPRVFKTCELTYKFVGGLLQQDRVLRAAALSYSKYCGVSAMIKRSGCVFTPRLYMNGVELSSEFHSVLANVEDTSVAADNETPAAVVKAAVLITGNELLSGKTKDTNGAFIISELSALGIQVSGLNIIGDDKHSLIAKLRDLAEHNDYIFMTGGLGPTGDDLTSEVVAEAFHLQTEFSDEAWAVCQAAFHRSGRTEIPESNKKQAVLPLGAKVLQNSLGTAAGFAVVRESATSNCTLYAMPGVPWECERMFRDEVKSQLGGTVRAYRQWGPWHVWGVGESALQTLLSVVEKDILALSPDVAISYQAHAGYISYGLQLPCEAGDDCSDNSDAVFSPDLLRIEEILGQRLLYQGGRTLMGQLLDGYEHLNLNFALAESCTGGKIASLVTQQSGISSVFKGGAVTYSNESKMSLLRVSPETLSHSGAVSVETAEEMARGVVEAFNSDLGLSVTGVAGPLGGSAEKPVGTVCFGLALKLDGTRADWLAPIENSLTLQGWSLSTRSSATDLAVFICEKRFGDYLSRELVQKRASVFALCTLVAVSESVRGLIK